MNENKTFVSKDKLFFFDEWFITDYISILENTQNIGTIETERTTYLVQKLQSKVSLRYIKFEKTNKDYGFCISQKTIHALPIKEMSPVLISMGSIFLYLPDDLNDYQMRRLAYIEGVLSYAAAYIVRKTWDKKLCPLPKVNNQIKHLLNTLSEEWFRLYKLCVACRDLLNNKELENIPRSWDWLRLIVQEYRKTYLKFLYSSEAEKHIPCYIAADNFRAYAKALNEGINPCVEEDEPYRYRLMEICINLADKADVFRQELWKPYLSSVRKKAEIVDRDTKILSVSCHNGSIKRNKQGTK